MNSMLLLLCNPLSLFYFCFCLDLCVCVGIGRGEGVWFEILHDNYELCVAAKMVSLTTNNSTNTITHTGQVCQPLVAKHAHKLKVSALIALVVAYQVLLARPS